uniref:Putative secreted protein n=1 Tax=Anopheles darlingi TaxID=43151 RepID=A0A2M4D7J5_ANODA
MLTYLFGASLTNTRLKMIWTFFLLVSFVKCRITKASIIRNIRKLLTRRASRAVRSVVISSDVATSSWACSMNPAIDWLTQPPLAIESVLSRKGELSLAPKYAHSAMIGSWRTEPHRPEMIGQSSTSTTRICSSRQSARSTSFSNSSTNV